MSNVEQKTPTVTTGKAKDVIKDPAALKAFGGDEDDVVVSIKLPKANPDLLTKANKLNNAVVETLKNPRITQEDVDDMLKKNLVKAVIDQELELANHGTDVTISAEQAKDYAALMLKNSPGLGRLFKVSDSKPPALEKLTLPDPWGSELGGRRATDLSQSEDQAPTDRQIKNAERILKAAGLDSESKIVEAVANALEKVQATGTFIYEGVLQEPIETDLKVDFNRINSKHLASPFYLPHPLGQAYNDKTFTLYKLRTGESEVYYLLDASSTVTLGGGDARPGYHRPENVPRRGVLCLINSSSNDDIVIGESTLVNTESAYNVLNCSVLARTKEPNHEYGYGFEYMAEAEPASRKKEVKERLNLKESQFKRTAIFDSSLAKGVYRDSQIHDSRIEGGNYVVVSCSNLQNSVIRGTRVTLKEVHLTKTQVTAEGELLVKYSRFSGVHIRANSVYIPNKFSFLELDTPQHKMYLVRSTRRDFDLGMSLHNMERFKLEAGDEELRKHITVQLTFDPEGFHTKPTTLARSVAGYLTDSIISRLRVIRLLDEAKQLVREIGAQTRPWDDMYSN